VRVLLGSGARTCLPPAVVRRYQQRLSGPLLDRIDIFVEVPRADMGSSDLRRFCEPDPAGKQLLNTTLRQMQLSARAYHRILKLSRTIADLAGSDTIQVSHIAEAIQYRPRRAV